MTGDRVIVKSDLTEPFAKLDPVRVTPEAKKRLAVLADKLGITISDIVREGLQSYLDQHINDGGPNE